MNDATGQDSERARDRWAHWRRRMLQAGFWVLTVGILWTLDTLTKFRLRERTGIGLDDFRLIAEQATSAAGALIMVGFVAWWLNHFPIRKSTPITTAAGHILGSVIFSLGHYALLVAFRIVVYSLNDRVYGAPASLISNLIFEYQKDVKIYLGIVIIITVYRLYLGGEKRLQVRPRRGQKMLVQTGTGQSVIDYEQIDYLESSRNYVVVHASDREYLVRDTMTNLLDKLESDRFVRTHRSFVVNLDKVEELRNADAGQVIRTKNGAEVPISRSYRDTFRARFSPT